jgi:hypothetical protein
MPGLEQLPKEGCMLVEFRRKRLTLEENGDGEETAGVTLELRAICLQEEESEDAAESLEDAFREPSKKSAEAEEDDED